MGKLFEDVRYSLRRLRNAPGFTLLVLATMALGIGANSAIFSVINAVLLRPLPYADPQSLVLLLEKAHDFPKLSVSYKNYRDWKEQSQSFSQFAAVRITFLTLTGGSEPERIPAQMASANLFDTLGVSVKAGRELLPSDDQKGAAGVVLIGNNLWQRRFNGSRAVLGQSINLDKQPYVIVGILPPAFQVLQQEPDVILPLEPWARTLPDDRAWHPGIIPIARLKPGVSLEQARAEMSALAKRILKQNPVDDIAIDANVQQLHQQLVENIRPALLVIAAAVGFVLLLACVNVANLLLARATAAQREIAVRLAIGASRARIARLLLTESILLALLGAGAGLMLALLFVPALVHAAGTSLPATANPQLDWPVIGFTAGIAVLAGILFGITPAIQLGMLNLRSTLNEADRGAVGIRAVRFRRTLVIAEVAIAIPLLIGAGLLIRTFARLSAVDPGFAPDHLLIADLPVAPAAHPKSPERMAFFDEIQHRAAALPGVRSAAMTNFVPVSGTGSDLHFNIQGRPPKSSADYTAANYRVVTADYLKTLHIPLVQGRWITDDDREKAPPVVVINATMARTYFPNQSPLGKRMQIGATPIDEVPWMEIVGIVGDLKQSLSDQAASEMYLPLRQADALLPVYGLSCVMRTAGDPNSVAQAFRVAVHQVDPSQPVVRIRTMEENIATSIAQPHFRTTLLTIFGIIALIMATVGIYGVMAYSVVQRTREMGVRMALGAGPKEIFKLVLRQALTLTVSGIILGLIAAAVLTRFMASLLFEVPALDPLTMISVSLALLVVTLAASYFPARNATRIDPMLALRAE